MEKYEDKIVVLSKLFSEKMGVAATILKYYGFAHQGAILMRTLGTDTKTMLDKFSFKTDEEAKRKVVSIDCKDLNWVKDKKIPPLFYKYLEFSFNFNSSKDSEILISIFEDLAKHDAGITVLHSKQKSDYLDVKEFIKCLKKSELSEKVNFVIEYFDYELIDEDWVKFMKETRFKVNDNIEVKFRSEYFESTKDWKEFIPEDFVKEDINNGEQEESSKPIELNGCEKHQNFILNSDHIHLIKEVLLDASCRWDCQFWTKNAWFNSFLEHFIKINKSSLIAVDKFTILFNSQYKSEVDLASLVKFQAKNRKIIYKGSAPFEAASKIKIDNWVLYFLINDVYYKCLGSNLKIDLTTNNKIIDSEWWEKGCLLNPSYITIGEFDTWSNVKEFSENIKSILSKNSSNLYLVFEDKSISEVYLSWFHQIPYSIMRYSEKVELLLFSSKLIKS